MEEECVAINTQTSHQSTATATFLIGEDERLKELAERLRTWLLSEEADMFFGDLLDVAMCGHQDASWWQIKVWDQGLGILGIGIA